MATNQGQSRRRRSQPDFSERRANRKGKKPLPEPTHIGHFALMLLLKVCRTVLFVDTSVKIGVYLIGVMVGSVFCDLFVVPKSYFSDKRNIFNTYFVKKGWGWTFVLVAPYIALSCWVYCFGRWQAVRRHLMRLVVATMEWYVCTTVFRHIENTVGVCTDSVHPDRDACIADGKGWLGFDISGHVFLLIHNMLTISEEVKTFKDWRKLGEMLEDEDLQSKRKVTAEEISEAQKYYKDFTPYIKAVFVAIAFLSVLWEFMLLMSVVYRFHTLPQKVTAAFIAVLCWFVNYRVIYQTSIEWLPCQPGKTNLEFMKIQ
ncbi:acyl-coenzyme A diphosphatase FITM2-like [Babylonia areolata]|uniref:acyl-coenzyme A diphosphatase FITM2-like n=1 Tax=Babylonia areolata TaxID=304850 RepID=UPI003FD1312B